MGRSLHRSRFPFVAPAMLVVAASFCGCGAGEPPSVAGRDAAGPRSFADQLADVHAGTATRIVVETPLTAADWERLRGLAALRELVLRGGVATDAEAEILATLEGLERLVLRESPLSDVAFRSIARLAGLQNLNVPQAACTAAGLRALQPLKKLRSLRLGGPNLAGPDVCRAVASLPAVESLHLVDVRIGDEGLDILAGMPRLSNLYLDGAGVSDEAWRGYFERSPDVHVHVDQAHHDRDPNRDHDAASRTRRGENP